MKDFTEIILKKLEDINKIPRGSENMKSIHEYFKNWAEKNSFNYKTDDALNIIIEIPPSKGFEKSPVIVIQGHMDMVCEKTPESNHDFYKDPITHIIDGDWLKADNTTLGADNGIALAMAMTAAEETDIEHPPLELLFTTDEEIGLSGASRIEKGFINGKILLNIDSEETGVFTTGCAGSSRTNIDIPVKNSITADESEALLLKIGGLQGGHSAMDINKSRGNACAIMVRGLSELLKDNDFFISYIIGGSAMNAIARSSEAVIVCEKNDIEKIKNKWNIFTETIISENNISEKNIKLSCEETELPLSVIKDTKELIKKLRVIPHGVVNMNPEFPDLLETSLNFAIITTTEKTVQVTTMQRSSVKTRLEDLTAKINTLSDLIGGKYLLEVFANPWQADMDSPLLKKSMKLWKDLYNSEAEIEITHGGLECGEIGNAAGGMDMISFGPDIENPHSPSERLNIPSVEKIFTFLRKLLISYKQES